MGGFTAKQNRDYRAMLNEKGLCHQCGIRNPSPVKPGYSVCEKHRKLRGEHVTIRMHAFIAEGLCATCGKEATNNIYCKKHFDINREDINKWRIKVWGERCHGCWKPMSKFDKVFKEYALCSECLEEGNKRRIASWK